MVLDTITTNGYNTDMNTPTNNTRPFRLRIVSVLMTLNALGAFILAVVLAINGDYHRALVGMAVSALSLLLSEVVHDLRREVSRVA